MAVPARLRRSVIERADHRCEYCGLSQLGQAATFHIGHVKPLIAGGETNLDNLALACVYCSLHKGARIAGRDTRTTKTVRLFHPRLQSWNHHFRWTGNKVVGITAIGRVTVELLRMNAVEQQLIRSFEAILGRHPPPRHV